MQSRNIIILEIKPNKKESKAFKKLINIILTYVNFSV